MSDAEVIQRMAEATAQRMGEAPETEPAQTQDEATQEVVDDEALQEVLDDEAAEEQRDIETTEEFSLSSLFGVDDEAIDEVDGEWKIRTKVDGQEQHVSFKDLLKGYQLEQHANRKSMEAAELQRQVAEERQQKQAQMDEQLGVIEAMHERASEALLAEFDGVDWNAMAAQNPGEAAWKQQQYAMRSQQILNDIENIKQQRREMAQQAEQEEKQQRHQHAVEQQQILFDKVPEWRDDATRRKDYGQIRETLQAYGCDESEISGINDHRLLLLAAGCRPLPTGDDPGKTQNGEKGSENPEARPARA